jgi:hypothetical protein
MRPTFGCSSIKKVAKKRKIKVKKIEKILKRTWNCRRVEDLVGR